MDLSEEMSEDLSKDLSEDMPKCCTYIGNNTFCLTVIVCADIFCPSKPFCHFQQTEKKSETAYSEDVHVLYVLAILFISLQLSSSVFSTFLRCHEGLNDEVGFYGIDVTTL